MSLLKESLESLVRHTLVLLFGFLVLPLIAHGWLTTGLGSKIEADINNWAALIAATILTAVVPQLWSWWRIIIAKVKIIVAAHLSPDVAPTTPGKLAVVEEKAASMPVPVKLALAITELSLPVPVP